MKGVWIGTSGWVYKHWAQSFYPKDWPKKDEFTFYASQFPTVEVNATFYRLPSLSMVRGWYKKAPKGFLFAVKGSRFITHIKRLKMTKASLNKYFKRIAPLKEKLGPILWQLPPNFKKTSETFARLKTFLKALPHNCQHAVEFREPGWFDAETFSALEKCKVANVWLSSGRMPRDFSITADFIYLRFHGLQGGAAHDYTKAELQPWAEHLQRAAREGLPAFVYFNNDLNTRAPLNAKMLMEMIGEPAVKPFAPEKVSKPSSKPRKIKKANATKPRSKRLRH